MKLSDINSLGLSEKTKSEIQFDPVAAIVTDEFHKAARDANYRENAISRMAIGCLPLSSNSNIAYELVSRYVRITCPYCEDLKPMKVTDGGGNSEKMYVTFTCQKCKGTAVLSLGGSDLDFRPHESKAK